MNFYTVIQKPNINIGEIEYSIFEWKILNIVTYINSIIYHNDNLITFYFEINEIICNFKIYYNTERWILEFDENINESNETHLKILNMVDVINNEMSELPISRLPNKIFDIIEIKIDETDFD
jgi:hypothetical protein